MQRIQYNEQQFKQTISEMSKLLNRVINKNKSLHANTLMLELRQQFLQIAPVTDTLLMTLQNAVMFSKKQLIHPAVLNKKINKRSFTILQIASFSYSANYNLSKYSLIHYSSI